MSDFLIGTATLAGLGAACYHLPVVYGFSPRELHRTSQAANNVPPAGLWKFIIATAKRAAAADPSRVVMTSCYRSADVNRLVGGRVDSKHLTGQAMDFAGDAEALQAFGSRARLSFDAVVNEGDHLHCQWG